MLKLAAIRIFVIAVGLWALAAQSATAGTMVVYSCHTPSGRAVGTDGWTLSTDNAAPGAGNSCTHGPDGVLWLAVERNGAHVDGEQRLSWTFRATEFTTISGFRAWVCGRALQLWGNAGFSWQAPIGVSHSIFIYKSLQGTPEVMGCRGDGPWWYNGDNAAGATALASPWLQMDVDCAGICDFEPRIAATMQMAAFTASITDPHAPTVGSASGSLTSTGFHTGLETIAFSAADRGVGLLRAIAEVQSRHEGPWVPMAESRLGGDACRPVGETAYLYEFASPQPCPTALSDVSVTMDNSRLGSGEHGMRVVLEDAAGNRTVAWESATYSVPTVPRPAQLKITTPTSRRLRSDRAFQVRGRLMDTQGNAIAGAGLGIETRDYLPKGDAPLGDWKALGSVPTDARGRFVVWIPRGPSRTIRVSYVASSTDSGPAAVTLSDFIVPARITVRVAQPQVRNGKTAVFRGRLAGPIPRGGVLVALEAREPGRWVPVATTRRRVRTSPSGAFVLHYRFHSTFRPTTYRFRVTVDEDSAFPYTRGTSRSVRVRVRP